MTISNYSKAESVFEFDKTICVCARKDLATWRISSEYILRNISSKKYCVIVPDGEVRVFMENTPPSFHVLSENDYLGSFKEQLLTKLPDENRSRFGWYLQQFIKLNALNEIRSDETFLIWDADTIPVKKLSFKNGALIGHYIGTENHHAYFDFINLALGLSKKVDYSFIAQCLAVKGKWFVDFKKHIECHTKKNWADGVIENINFDEPAGFSEYETLGTYINYKYPDEIYVINGGWHREGKSLIRSVKNINNPFAKIILGRYDFVSFEGWDEGSLKRTIKLLAQIVTEGLKAKAR
jgi:hypothetical protein